jgi:Tol biopolymer transport system component
VHDFARSTSTRLTSHRAWDWLAAWSPDGNRIIFSSERDALAFNLYQSISSGAGSEELLYKSNEDKNVQDWSSDGRFLLYSVATSGGRSLVDSANYDLWVLPLTPGNAEDRKAQPYLQTEFDESQGKFSPDGRFIAYRSNASVRDEIYVEPFPKDSRRKWKVSTEGGTSPRWSGDGKELFYISPDSKMMAVEVSTSPDFKAGIPKALFPALPALASGIRNVTPYDVTADGKKFLIINAAGEAGAPGTVPIMVVLNWRALLKK